MDLLDRVAGPGLDLLSRVDAALVAGGAPAGDPVWTLLRRAGALPGDLLEQLLAAGGDDLAQAADQIHADARALDRDGDTIPGVAGWRGGAAEAFAGQWSAAVGHSDQIVERLGASADFAADVAAWVAATRRQVAGAIAECLASREAATVRLAGAAPDTGTCAAAAAIAAHVLTVVVDAAQAGEALRQRWSGRLDEVRYQPPASVSSASAPATIEIGAGDQTGGRG
jgi:hypothetical protein